MYESAARTETHEFPTYDAHGATVRQVKRNWIERLGLVKLPQFFDSHGRRPIVDVEIVEPNTSSTQAGGVDR